MKTENGRLALKNMRGRYKRLKERLMKPDLVLLGTITERKIEREDPKKPGEKKTYGPYYQWTFKIEGKTVTKNLTAQQAGIYQKAIENHRKMEGVMKDMTALSLKILEASTKGVKNRKRKEMK